MTTPTTNNNGATGRLQALVQRTGFRFGGWPQLLSFLLLLAVSVVTNLQLLPAYALTAPALLVALTSFGVKRGLIVGLSVAVLSAPMFQPLLAPVSATITGLACGYLGLRRWNFLVALFTAGFGAVGYGVFYVLAMTLLIPILHVATLYSWELMPTCLVSIVTAYCGYRYVRSAHAGENWKAFGLAALLGAAWFAVPLAVFMSAGNAYVGVTQFLPAIGALAFALICSGFVFLVTWRSARNDGRNRLVAELKMVGLAVLWCAVPFTVFASTNEKFVELQMRYSMHPELVTDVPYTVNDRILPRCVGESYVQNANTENLFTTEKPHIQYKDGRMLWQSPLHNHRWYGQILGAVPQVIRIDADRTEMHKEETDGSSFRYGNDSWVVKSAFRARHPFSQVAESAYYNTDDGQWVLLLSYVSKRPTWTGTMIPYLAGVMAVDQKGVIRDYTVREAEAKFPGAAFYPPELQRKYADAYAAWHAGFFETWVGQAHIAEVSESAKVDISYNKQPYIINFESWGLQGVVALEPKGDKQYALIELLFFDASSGHLRSWVPSKNRSMNGPQRAMDQVRSSDTQTDWSHRDTVEPRFVNGPRGMYWLGAIVTKEPEKPGVRAYITSVLVDADTLDAYRKQHSADIREFVAQPRPAAK